MARLSPTARRGSEGLGKQPQLMPGPESKQSQADEIRSILALKQSLSDQHDIAVADRAFAARPGSADARSVERVAVLLRERLSVEEPADANAAGPRFSSPDGLVRAAFDDDFAAARIVPPTPIPSGRASTSGAANAGGLRLFDSDAALDDDDDADDGRAPICAAPSSTDLFCTAAASIYCAVVFCGGPESTDQTGDYTDLDDRDARRPVC